MKIPKLTPRQQRRANRIGARPPLTRRQERRQARIAARSPVTSAPLTQEAPAPPPAIPPLNTAPLAGATPPAAPAGPSQDQVNTLFPSTRMFEPKNYEGSPLYKFQVQEGQKQLQRSLAARGLANSGYGIEQELNIPLRAAAQDTDRMTRIASENADRLKSFQDAEALRQERAGNAQWDRALSVAELMSRQTPWAGALAGLNNTADITSEAGKAQANFLADWYKRAMAGGGGGAAPLPLPSGPDYGNITPAQIGGDYSSNNGWMNLLTQGISSLF